MPNDLRSMLTEAKIGQYQAAMAIQYMNFLPETCDLYAQGVILIIHGLQNLLNDRGASLEADGDFNVETMGALEHFAGPNWHSKSWTQLYGDVIAGKPYGGKFRKARGVALAGPQQELGHTAYQHVGGADGAGVSGFQVLAMALGAFSGNSFQGGLGAVAGAIAGYMFPAATTAVVGTIVVGNVYLGKQRTTKAQQVARATYDRSESERRIRLGKAIRERRFDDAARDS